MNILSFRREGDSNPIPSNNLSVQISKSISDSQRDPNENNQDSISTTNPANYISSQENSNFKSSTSIKWKDSEEKAPRNEKTKKSKENKSKDNKTKESKRKKESKSKDSKESKSKESIPNVSNLEEHSQNVQEYSIQNSQLNTQSIDTNTINDNSPRLNRPRYIPPECPYKVTRNLTILSFGDPPSDSSLPSKVPTDNIFLKNYKARRYYDDFENPNEKIYYNMYIDDQGKFNVIPEKNDNSQVFSAENATAAWNFVTEARNQFYKSNSKVSGPKHFGVTDYKVRRILCSIVMDRELSEEEWSSVKTFQHRERKEFDPEKESEKSGTVRKRKRKETATQQAFQKISKKKVEAPVIENTKYKYQGFKRNEEQEQEFLSVFMKNFSQAYLNQYTKNMEDNCFVCKKQLLNEVDNIKCTKCNKKFHVACIDEEFITTDQSNLVCPRHICCCCGVHSVNIRCSMCTNSFCSQCQSLRMISEESSYGVCLCFHCTEFLKKLSTDTEKKRVTIQIP